MLRSTIKLTTEQVLEKDTERYSGFSRTDGSLLVAEAGGKPHRDRRTQPPPPAPKPRTVTAAQGPARGGGDAAVSRTATRWRSSAPARSRSAGVAAERGGRCRGGSGRGGFRQSRVTPDCGA